MSFLEPKTKDHCKKGAPYTQEYGGCPCWSCNIYQVLNLRGPDNEFSLYGGQNGTIVAHIPNPWDNRWAQGEMIALYAGCTASKPSADIMISRELTLPIPTQKEVTSEVLQSEQSLQQALQQSSTPTWLQQFQASLQLMNLTTSISVIDCFLCASLQRPLLAAVPINASSSIKASPALRNSSCAPPLPSVPLWHLTLHKFPCVEEHTPVTPRSRHLARCLLSRHGRYKFGNLRCRRRLRGGALGHSVISARDFEERLQITLESTSASLASLQRQFTSLAQVALQNRRALDLLTAKKGGTCFFLREECCYFVNESRIVEQNVNKLTDLAKDLLRRPSKNTLTDLLSSPLVTWLLPFLGPLLMLIALCTLLPCLLWFLRSQVNRISNQTFNQLLLQGYHPLIAQPEDTRDEPYRDTGL
ncbi:ERV-BabFcenv provirus ancestral Env polyprotein-like [Castor canadensis]|uniref:ERV-BabFcenv provirus ancestral Env polyprotein-like n=1 Tax=Castor canadensis TaxID=51338 RepID=A0AC58M0X0_CASCN